MSWVSAEAKRGKKKVKKVASKAQSVVKKGESFVSKTANKAVDNTKAIVERTSDAGKNIIDGTKRGIYKARDGVFSIPDQVKNQIVPEYDIPDQSTPAAAAPDAEVALQQQFADENITRRKRKGRNKLRIDLNTGGAPSGNGVNLPVG